MKLTSKLVMLCAFALLFIFASCGKELCYECKGYDDGTVSLEDLGTICEGDADNATKEDLEDAVTIYEALGGTCTKK